MGRDAELTQLHELFDKALNGERHLVFVTGEPGIGKTTLVEAFLQTLDADARSQTLVCGVPGAMHRAVRRRRTIYADLEALGGLCRTRAENS